MKLYPYDLPGGVHPNIWWLLGFGLTPEQANAIARHLSDDLGLRLNEERETKTYSWVVDLAGDYPDRTPASVGSVVDIQVAENGAVRLSGGAPPPGVRLDRTTGKLVGEITHPGLYSVSIEVGPTVKYDPLGSPGGPLDPGVWIPVDRPRQEVQANLDAIPTRVSQLSDRDKDHALAELMAWSDGVKIKEADNGY